MALAASNLCSTGSAGDATGYAMPSADYPANSLILFSVNNSKAASVNVVQTIAGLTGATWTQQDSVVFNTTGTPLNRLSVWYTMIQTSQNGVVLTASYAATQTGFAGSVDVITGCATSGSNGIGAVVQSNSKSTIATTLTVTVGSGMETTNNRTFSAFGRVTNTTILSVAANFTQLADLGAATPAKRLMTQIGLTTGHTVTASMAASDDLTGVGIEVRVQTAAAAATRQIRRLLMGVGV